MSAPDSYSTAQLVGLLREYASDAAKEWGDAAHGIDFIRAAADYIERSDGPNDEVITLLPGMREAMLYFVGTRNAQAVYDNIKAAIEKMERPTATVERSTEGV